MTVEQLAYALALEYYRGYSYEVYADKNRMKLIAGPVADDPEASVEWIEDQAVSQANNFWSMWVSDAKKLLEMPPPTPPPNE